MIMNNKKIKKDNPVNKLSNILFIISGILAIVFVLLVMFG